MLLYLNLIFLLRNEVESVIDAYEKFSPNQLQELKNKAPATFIKGLEKIKKFQKNIQKKDCSEEHYRREQKKEFECQILFQKKALKIFNEIANMIDLDTQEEKITVEQEGDEIIVRDEKNQIIIKISSGSDLFLKD